MGKHWRKNIHARGFDLLNKYSTGDRVTGRGDIRRGNDGMPCTRSWRDVFASVDVVAPLEIDSLRAKIVIVGNIEFYVILIPLYKLSISF